MRWRPVNFSKENDCTSLKNVNDNELNKANAAKSKRASFQNQATMLIS